MRIVAEKYHGLGNDYLYMTLIKTNWKLTPSNVQLMCNRNFGVVQTGVLEGPVLDGEQISMVVWNWTAVLHKRVETVSAFLPNILKDAGYVQKGFTISSQGGGASIHYLNEEAPG